MAMGNIGPTGSGTYFRDFFGSPPFVQMPYVVEDVFARDDVREVFFRVGREDIGEERVWTFGRLMLPGDVIPKRSFSLLNVRCAEPCAMAGSAVNDGPGFPSFVEPEFRACASTRHFASISFSAGRVVQYARPILDATRFPRSISTRKVAACRESPKNSSAACFRVMRRPASVMLCSHSIAECLTVAFENLRRSAN
jgi:hypothetical protein